MRPTTALLAVALLLPAPARADEVTPTVPVTAGRYTRCATCMKPDQVEIDLHAFQIDRDEVTQRQYAACAATKKCAPLKSKPKATELDQPVRSVTWAEADAYCRSVGKRLPTEAEWERAAFPPVPGAKPDDGPRIGGREPCKALLIGGYDGKRCGGAARKGPVQVAVAALAAGQKEGLLDHVTDGPDLYDLYGNVAEWVSDWDALPGNPEYYFKPKTRTNPTGPASGTERVIRGGSYAALDGSAAGERRRAKPANRMPDVGFRCAADAK